MVWFSSDMWDKESWTPFAFALDADGKPIEWDEAILARWNEYYQKNHTLAPMLKQEVDNSPGLQHEWKKMNENKKRDILDERIKFYEDRCEFQLDYLEECRMQGNLTDYRISYILTSVGVTSYYLNMLKAIDVNNYNITSLNHTIQSIESGMEIELIRETRLENLLNEQIRESRPDDTEGN